MRARSVALKVPRHQLLRTSPVAGFPADPTQARIAILQSRVTVVGHSDDSNGLILLPATCQYLGVVHLPFGRHLARLPVSSHELGRRLPVSSSGLDPAEACIAVHCLRLLLIYLAHQRQSGFLFSDFCKNLRKAELPVRAHSVAVKVPGHQLLRTSPVAGFPANPPQNRVAINPGGSKRIAFLDESHRFRFAGLGETLTKQSMPIRHFVTRLQICSPSFVTAVLATRCGPSLFLLGLVSASGLTAVLCLPAEGFAPVRRSGPPAGAITSQ